jgi:signal transduction histidine kinase
MMVVSKLHTSWNGEILGPRVSGDPAVVMEGCLLSSSDVTERKQAEEALRKTQADLARISRITTMGELTASLAHEVNQPIAAAATDANTCLRWLERDQPELEEARSAASRGSPRMEPEPPRSFVGILITRSWTDASRAVELRASIGPSSWSLKASGAENAAPQRPFRNSLGVKWRKRVGVERAKTLITKEILWNPAQLMTDGRSHG